MNAMAYYFALIAVMFGLSLIYVVKQRNTYSIERDAYYTSLVNECDRQGAQLVKVGYEYRCAKFERIRLDGEGK